MFTGTLYFIDISTNIHQVYLTYWWNSNISLD